MSKNQPRLSVNRSSGPPMATLRLPDELKTAHSLKGKHILSAGQFSRQDVEDVMRTAEQMSKVTPKHEWSRLLHGLMLACVFYEPSSRTFGSFLSAMQRLGGGIIPLQGMAYSSVAKGETLVDTMRTFEAMADVLVLRHPTMGSAAKAADCLKKPLLNAGDGIGEHPTQALLDLFTIRRERGALDGLTVTMVGDLKHGRTVHSLARLLAKYHVSMRFVAPPELQVSDGFLEGLGCRAGEFGDRWQGLEQVIGETDVLYVTRIQRERMDGSEFERVKGHYRVTPDLMKLAKPDMTLMHPLPRVDEISEEVDADPRAAYFRQIENGVSVRMALLAMVLGAV